MVVKDEFIFGKIFRVKYRFGFEFGCWGGGKYH